MDSNLLYNQFWQQLASCNNITGEYLSSLRVVVYQSYWQNRFSEPMLWIGMYIALASLFCILGMAADLLHGLKNRKLWFPCKYFTLDAASITVIAVAIKLPMDLSNQTQVAKLGSLAFMCTMMTNLLPSLATMKSKELVSNIIAFGVLVITLVVNVRIQRNTGAFSYRLDEDAFKMSVVFKNFPEFSTGTADFGVIARFYENVLLALLVLYACSSLAMLKCKQIIESKHEEALKDQELQQPGRLTIEKLKEHVSNCWIMAETGSPQFMAACFATTTASAVLCCISTMVHILVMLYTFQSHYTDKSDFNSDYKWSMSLILIIQNIGIVLGSIAPICRCFAALSFKMSIKWILNHVKIFKVESYWTQKLCDWEQSSIPFRIGSRKCKIVIHNLKILILIFCTGFQSLVVVECKIIAVIPVFFVICIFYCSRFWKWLLAMLSNSGVLLVQNANEQLGKDKDLSRYVLQLEEDMEFAERTLKVISKSVNRLIQKAENQQPKNLMKLVAGSTGFEGLEKFDTHDHVPMINCWSLPLVTLTTIAMSLPNIQKNIVDCLLSGVSEGLVYVTLVEESLNATDDHVSIQKAAKTLWLEVELYHKWLGNKLPKQAPQAITAGQILQWFRDSAKSIVTEVESIPTRGRNDNSKCRFNSANSMYRITETVLQSYHETVDEVSQEELFTQLSSMIADILAACLTNLPQVIAMKCHTSAIEKREESVHLAAQLLGETAQIINTLQDRELPSLNSDDLAFIDEWRAFIKHPFP